MPYKSVGSKLYKSQKKPAEPPATSLEPAVPKVGGGGGDGTHHPFIQGLLQKLPPPESNWEDAERVKWLDAAVRIFNLMYQGGSDTISVEVKK